MAIMDRFKNIFQANSTKQQGNMVGYFGVGSGESRQYNYQDLAKEGYLKNAIVYRCVNEIAKGAGAVKYMLKSGDTPLEMHPMLELLDRPHPQQSNTEFFSSLFGYLLLSGNAYVLKVGGDMAPRELHLLRPDRIVVKGGNNPIPEKYEYMINGGL